MSVYTKFQADSSSACGVFLWKQNFTFVRSMTSKINVVTPWSRICILRNLFESFHMIALTRWANIYFDESYSTHHHNCVGVWSDSHLNIWKLYQVLKWLSWNLLRFYTKTRFDLCDFADLQYQSWQKLNGLWESCMPRFRLIANAIKLFRISHKWNLSPQLVVGHGFIRKIDYQELRPIPQLRWHWFRWSEEVLIFEMPSIFSL